MSVKRYDLVTIYRGHESWDEMEDAEDGTYVRHDDYAELESKLETALRECRSAGITIDNLESKCAALAAENDGMSAFVDALLSIAWQGCSTDGAEIQDLALKHGLLRHEVYSADKHENHVDDPGNFEEGDSVYFRVENPATDAFMAEVRAQGVEMYAQKCNSKSEQSFAPDIRDNWKLLGEHATDFAAELRKGGDQ